MKGNDFGLSLSDFSLSFEGADDQPKIDWLLPCSSGDVPVRNELEYGSAVTVQGRFLKLDGDTAKVVFKEIGADTTVEVTAFQSAGPDILSFDWPASLAGDKSYEVTVKRTQEDGTIRTSNVKRVTVKGSAPTMTLTGVHAPGIEPPMIHLESGIWFDGTGLDGWTGGANDEVLAKNNRAEEAEWTRVDLHEDVGGEVVFDGGMLKMDEGAWTILDNLGITEGSEVRFKVTIAGQSDEIVATVAEA